jgi:hypothetical protein
LEYLRPGELKNPNQAWDMSSQAAPVMRRVVELEYVLPVALSVLAFDSHISFRRLLQLLTLGAVVVTMLPLVAVYMGTGGATVPSRMRRNPRWLMVTGLLLLFRLWGNVAKRGTFLAMERQKPLGNKRA